MQSKLLLIHRNLKLSPFESENKLYSILLPLLRTEGWDIKVIATTAPDTGIDVIGTKGPTDIFEACKIGIIYKFRKRHQIQAHEIIQAVERAKCSNCDRIILLTNSSFTLRSRIEVMNKFRFKLELLELEDLRGWINRIDIDETILWSRGLLFSSPN